VRSLEVCKCVHYRIDKKDMNATASSRWQTRVPCLTCLSDDDADGKYDEGADNVKPVTALVTSVHRPLNEHFDLYKVVYCMDKRRNIQTTVAVLALRVRVGSTKIYENPPFQHYLEAEHHPLLQSAQQNLQNAQEALRAITTQAKAPSVQDSLKLVRKMHDTRLAVLQQQRRQAKDLAVKRVRGGLLRGLIKRVFKRKATAAAVAQVARRLDEETEVLVAKAREALEGELKTAEEDANARAAREAALLPERIARCKDNVKTATDRVAEVQSAIVQGSLAQFAVPYSRLTSQRQYAVDEALVTAVKFVNPNAMAAQDCANQYQYGEVQLVPQFCVHNPTRPFMKYEVGCVARESQAGVMGSNGCIKGIHVHMTEEAALRHAKSMCVLPEDLHQRSVLNWSIVPVWDEPAGYKLEWKRWNCRPNPWQNNAETKCLACTKPMNESVVRYAVMDCGHGYMCGQCASVAKENMQCPECSIRALRISEVW
jgi:hypothetical protein